jgi:hypothetical protein
MSDFPAAHSMDTTWFAIDSDGYVGIFDSGEGGAVPDKLTPVDRSRVEIESIDDVIYALQTDKHELIQEISSANISSIIERASMDSLRYHINNNSYSGMIHSLLLQLSSVRTIDDLKLQANSLLRFTDRDIWIYVDKCDRDWLEQAIDSGTVLSGSEILLYFDLSWLGCYTYTCKIQSPIPYQRNSLVGLPIKFEELPIKIRECGRFTKLTNIHFATTEAIQPIEHLACRTWGGIEYWLDTNGVEHDRFPEYPIDRAD